MSLFLLVERRGIPLLRLRLALVPLAGLIQAGFDHRLLDSPPDCLAYADALAGPIPLLLIRIAQRTG